MKDTLSESLAEGIAQSIRKYANGGSSVEFNAEIKGIQQIIESCIKKIAQSCYLECLAVECGEGEASRAIWQKFPNLVSRHKEKENE